MVTIVIASLLSCLFVVIVVWCLAFRKVDRDKGGSFAEPRIKRKGFSSIPLEESIPFPPHDGPKLNLRI